MARKKKAPAGVGPRRGRGGVTDAVPCVVGDGVAAPLAARTWRRGVRVLLPPAMARPLTRPAGGRGGTSRGGDVP
ncbi:hypothetical protein ACNF49_14880 [Actinomadura sp. ATCC 39365]|uniref:hypothetical protein n=1 Tax=Nonomuraea sp. NPDC005692 TaxID=3157168 RepID=UPI0033F6C9AC